MASKIKNNPISSSISTKALLDTLRSKNLSFVLGNSLDTNEKTNTTESFSEALNSSSLAIKITNNKFMEVIPVPEGGEKFLKTGVIPGYFQSSNEQAQQFYFVQDNMLYFILTPKDGREDYQSSIKISQSFVDSSGNIAHSKDGFSYCAVAALPDGVSEISRKYIPIVTAKDEVYDYNNSDASKLLEAKRICGSSSELRTGNCCLYYDESEYNPIEDTYYNVGDFYRCFDTKCYKCIELAKKLNKHYVFHKHSLSALGPTGGTGERCLDFDNENFPTKCGICSCRTDKKSTSYYEDIISDINVSESLSVKRNCKIDKVGREKLSGAISSITVDLSGASKEAKTLSTDYLNSNLFVPLIGDGTTEALFPITSVLDAEGNKTITGIGLPNSNGMNYTTAKVDVETLSKMFPNLESSRFKVNLFPINGPHANMRNILKTSVLLSMNINSSDIENITEQTIFNRFGLATIRDSEGININSGRSEREEVFTDLTTKLNATKQGILEISSSVDTTSSKATVDNTALSGDDGKRFDNTSLEVNVVNFKRTSSFGAEMQVNTNMADVLDGKTVTDDLGDTYTINSITKPTSAAGNDISLSDQEVLHRNTTNINLNYGTNQNRTYRFEILVGFNSGNIIT